MSRNVPSDWDQYYSDCSLCGQRYHASDGGCGCIEEECECGGCWFERRDEEIICSECGTGPWCEESQKTTRHRAQKHHAQSGAKKGEWYNRTIIIGQYPNGKVTRDIFYQLCKK